MPNRLAAESSPYLRQHAENPVDWYPWGPEALEKSRAENKPILLSIGYAACHWCHVMAHESFEDDSTAAVMNKFFVNIKVDREERPDLDSIYMQAVQSMTGHGGWPMTVFLTPAGEPFWGGTYFPPDDRMGMPSFKRVLAAVADAYASRPDQVTKAVSAMRDLYETTSRSLPAGELSRATLDRAFSAASASYDAQFGGFGGAPKFPPTMLLEFLLTRWARTGDAQALHIAHDTFNAMAAGGIHDHAGGGFHRYTVDRHWLVPHFEKMLYDNALLARFGAHLWQATHDDNVQRAVEGILRWLSREMTSPDGGFYASLDADSEGHEGLFYTWTAKEFDAITGAASKDAREWFGVSDAGNFEGRNILHVPAGGIAGIPKRVADLLTALYDVRARRVWPGLDDKIIAAWNGLTLRGVATCARVFRRDDWSELALRNARFLAAGAAGPHGIMRILSGGRYGVTGFLEDHAAVALGFIATWELTGDREWLERARVIAETIRGRFWEDALPGFYDVPDTHEPLITRPRDLYDNATPSGSSLAIDLFLQLGYITGDDALTDMAHRALAPLAEPMARHPHAFGHALSSGDRLVHGTTAVAVVGAATHARELSDVAGEIFLPSATFGRSEAGENADLALFHDRDARGAAAAAYVCRGNVCDVPASTSAELVARIAGAFPTSTLQRNT
jgi:uncharacterized protein YyaL (SSP411 family)